MKTRSMMTAMVKYKRKRKKKKNKAVATASVACGWAEAVTWGAGAVGGAVYTRASVTCDWAGAVMQKPLAEYLCDGHVHEHI